MSRAQQPHRSGSPRAPGAALDAMLAGRSASGWNPQDLVRAVQKDASAPAAAAPGRKPRAWRAPRVPRSPR